MKRFLIFIVLLLSGCYSSRTSKYYQDGALGDCFELTLAYDESRSDFFVSLINKSGRDVRVFIPPSGSSGLFQGSIFVEGKNGERKELVDEVYLTLLQTSVWTYPESKMLAGQSVHWRLPITSLKTSPDGQKNFLSSGGEFRAYAFMPKLAVVPRWNGYAEGNAQLRSKEIIFKIQSN